MSIKLSGAKVTTNIKAGDTFIGRLGLAQLVTNVSLAAHALELVNLTDGKTTFRAYTTESMVEHLTSKGYSPVELSFTAPEVREMFGDSDMKPTATFLCDDMVYLVVHNLNLSGYNLELVNCTSGHAMYRCHSKRAMTERLKQLGVRMAEIECTDTARTH